jgi:hypothetical protein
MCFCSEHFSAKTVVFLFIAREDHGRLLLLLLLLKKIRFFHHFTPIAPPLSASGTGHPQLILIPNRLIRSHCFTPFADLGRYTDIVGVLCEINEGEAIPGVSIDSVEVNDCFSHDNLLMIYPLFSEILKLFLRIW